MPAILISYAQTIYIYIRGVQGGSAENPPVIENLAKSPLSDEVGPPSPSRRAKLGENFLGFFREFSGKFRVF